MCEACTFVRKRVCRKSLPKLNSARFLLLLKLHSWARNERVAARFFFACCFVQSSGFTHKGCVSNYFFLQSRRRQKKIYSDSLKKLSKIYDDFGSLFSSFLEKMYSVSASILFPREGDQRVVCFSFEFLPIDRRRE